MPDYKVTVLTPAYNRASLLTRLYDSLTAQENCSRFQWVVVDDGSSDDTWRVLQSFEPKEFDVVKLHKENGGKHTAINYAHKHIRGSVVAIVDCDDVLTKDAVSTIESDFNRWLDDPAVCCASYCRAHFDGTLISEADKSDVVSTHAQYRIKERRGGDRFEVLKTSELLRRPFPEYDGERFMSEGWLWIGLSNDGLKTLYRQKAIYLCDYLPGGLTQSGRKLRLASPFGMMENCKAYMQSDADLFTKIKERILYWVYSFSAGQGVGAGIRNSEDGLLMGLWMLPGLFFYHKWKSD